MGVRSPYISESQLPCLWNGDENENSLVGLNKRIAENIRKELRSGLAYCKLLSMLVLISGRGQYGFLKEYFKFSWCTWEKGGGEERRNLAYL